MKKLLLVLFVILTTSIYSQEVFNLDTITKKPKTEAQLIGKSTKTLDLAIYKGVKYPVYNSVKGKKFIIYVNRNNNLSKKYI